MQATIAAKPKGVEISSKRPKEVLKRGNKKSSPIFSVLHVSANLKRIDLINIDVFTRDRPPGSLAKISQESNSLKFHWAMYRFPICPNQAVAYVRTHRTFEN